MTSHRSLILCAASLGVLLVAPRAAGGDGPVFSGASMFPGGSFETLAAGDLDEDGLADIAVNSLVGLGNSDVLILLNAGEDGFTQRASVPVGFNVRKLAIGDLDDDGHQDLAMAIDGPLDELLGVHFGNGTGTFSSSAFRAVAAGPWDVDLVDLDADGDLDVVVPGSESGRISVILNNNGILGTATDVAAGATPRAIAAGDVDGDAVVDLVVANQSTGSVSVLIGQGDGSFVSASSVAVGGSPEDVGLGDWNGDGDLDLAVGHNDSFYSRLSGDGSGGFGGQVDVPVFGDAQTVVVSDMDEDGLADVAVLNAPVFVQADISTGAGSFDSHRQGVQSSADDLIVHDMTGDGDLDMATAGTLSFFGGGVTVLEGNGSGSFGPLYRGDDGCFDVQFGDLDEDGIADMVLVNEFSDDITVFPGSGNGFYGTGTDQGLGDRPTSATIADFNGDNHLDVAVSMSTDDEISLLLGDGSGALAAPLAIPANDGPRTVQALDVDGDLDADMLVTGFLDNTLAVLRNDGSGVFGAPELLATTEDPHEIAVGDMNADGLTDIVVCTLSGNVHVYRADGAGFFQAALSFNAATSCEGVDLGDMDADGDLDVVVCRDDFALGVGVLFNDGSGLLTSQSNFSGGGGNQAGIVVADFDRDGNLDIVVGNQSASVPAAGDSLGLLLGDGDGSFAPTEEIFTAAFMRRLTRFDCNGDGAMDVAAPGYSDEVHLFINRRGPWQDLGFPLAGQQGLPKQVGEGTLLGGETFTFTLTDARPNSVISHIVGVSAILAPFKGGIWVPNPDLINAGLPTDADGGLVLTGPWLTGASGLEVWLQFWGADPAAVKGFAASNAIRASVP